MQGMIFVSFFFTGFERNFKKYNHGDIDRLEAPYDMTSLMHLPKNAFSKNGLNTLEARAGPNVPIGRTDGLSEIDKAQLNLLYSCTEYPSKSSSRNCSVHSRNYLLDSR